MVFPGYTRYYFYRVIISNKRVASVFSGGGLRAPPRERDRRELGRHTRSVHYVTRRTDGGDATTMCPGGVVLLSQNVKIFVCMYNVGGGVVGTYLLTAGYTIGRAMPATRAAAVRSRRTRIR